MDRSESTRLQEELVLSCIVRKKCIIFFIGFVSRFLYAGFAVLACVSFFKQLVAGIFREANKAAKGRVALGLGRC